MDLDWQLKLKSISERNAHLFATGVFADCSFKTSGSDKIFAAHKLILSTASPVFEKMLFGPMAENSDKPIIIDDIDENDFFDMLYFLYCDDVKIGSIEKAGDLMYVAKKYSFDQLSKKCLSYMMGNLKPENVFSILDIAKRFEESNLTERGMECIRSKTSEVLLSPEIFLASLDILKSIVEQPMLGATELELFTALEKYAKFHNISVDQTSVYAEKMALDKASSSETTEQQKSTQLLKLTQNDKLVTTFATVKTSSQMEEFQKLIRNIRFLTMTITEFARGPAISKILHPKDALAIFACIGNKELKAEHFPKGFIDVQMKRDGKQY